MKMKVSGFENIEMAGYPTDIHKEDGHLQMKIHLTTPLGWYAVASLTRKDVWIIFKQMLKPSNWLYLFCG